MQVTFSLDLLIKEYGGKLFHAIDDDHFFIKRQVVEFVSSKDMPSKAMQKSKPDAKVDEVPAYDSDDDDLFDPSWRALVVEPDLMTVARALESDSTGSFPSHCPVASCRQRFSNKSRACRHYGKVMDKDHSEHRAAFKLRSQRNDLKGLLTDRDNCTKSPSYPDRFCPNCQIAAQNGHATAFPKSRTSVKRKKSEFSEGSYEL